MKQFQEMKKADHREAGVRFALTVNERNLYTYVRGLPLALKLEYPS